MKIIRNNPIAFLALFIALGSSGAMAASKITSNQIARDAVLTKHIKAGAVNGSKVADGSIGEADVARESLRGEQIADASLSTDDIADGGVMSDDVLDGDLKGADLAGDTVGARELGPLEPWRLVGQSGQPSFGSMINANWSNFDHAHNPAGFYKDPYGIVHLKGLVKCLGSNCPTADGIFALPSGYRPAAREVFLVASNDGTTTKPARLNIDASGLVTTTEIGGRNWLSLDGITFRTPGS